MDTVLEAVTAFFTHLHQDVIVRLYTEALLLFVPKELYTFVVRMILPVLAVLIVVRCVIPLVLNRRQDRIWGYLCVTEDTRIPLMHWENSIGRSKLSDIVINLPFISRSHAVLSFSEGIWSLTDLGSKGGVAINGKRIENKSELHYGDYLSLAGAELQLLPPGLQEAPESKKGRFSELRFATNKTLLLLICFQVMAFLQLLVSQQPDEEAKQPVIFLLFFAVELGYYFASRTWSKRYSEILLLAYFLSGMNMLVVQTADPSQSMKQLLSMLLGIAAYTFLLFLVKDLTFARKLRYALAGAALLLILLNLIFGEVINGAKNWIDLGFVTFQPMEFVKVSFVFAGAATLDRLLTTRNLTAFIGFSGVCVGALVLMRDLGTAVIFFGAFLVIAFLRSGDIRTIALICAGAVLGAVAVVSLRPYVAARFAVWRHVWEFEDTTGYQQTRTMIAAASGGLFGVGGGRGYLVHVAASDTDLVFGMLCEEWGFIVALCVIAILLFFAVFSVLMMSSCRSSFYGIAACGASSIFLLQTSLNVFGSVDFLPLTGVTMPFVSVGGSSMIVSWALLALIKASDERPRPGAQIDEEFDEDAFFRENGWML